MWLRHCTLAMVASVATAAWAQVPNAPAARLLNAKSIDCTFSVLATGTWKDGVAEGVVKPSKLTIGFTAIDTQDGTADAVDNAGKAHITVRVIGNYLNLMQMDPYGAVYITTVFSTQTTQGRLLAVHTRHEYTPVQVTGFTSRPEQYYGDCNVR